MRKTIEGKKVRDVMSRNPITVSPDTTVQELLVSSWTSRTSGARSWRTPREITW